MHVVRPCKLSSNGSTAASGVTSFRVYWDQARIGQATDDILLSDEVPQDDQQLIAPLWRAPGCGPNPPEELGGFHQGGEMLGEEPFWVFERADMRLR